MKLAAWSALLVLAAGSSLVFADDLDDALAALKQAPPKDAAKIKQLAAAAHATAKKYEGPAPADADKESYEARARYAKEVDTYSEYALYAAAIQDPKAAVDLITTLEQQNPKSQYLDQPDALVILGNNAYARKQADRALSYASRILAAKKPEDTPAADWERMKSVADGSAYFLIGVINFERNKFLDADKNLRLALPLIKGNSAITAAALFDLGVANYNLSNLTASKAKMLDAAKFSDQAAAIPGPYQDQAYKNAQAMKAKAETMR
jgi:tetratricopeptide (TPR) repeat protein